MWLYSGLPQALTGERLNCGYYRTVSFISHPNKVTLKIILNRLKPQAEKIIAEEQAGLRAGRGTTEQIFNLRIFCEISPAPASALPCLHTLIQFKKAFDRVWHAALWATMKKYNISANLVRVMKNLYDKAISEVVFNSNIRDWFRTTVGVRQGCLPSPTRLNIFLERIMTDALEDHEGTVSIGSRKITNLCFADDTEGLAGEEQELAKLVERLDKPEVLSRIAQTIAALTRLNPVWNNMNVSLSSKVRLMRSLVTSIFLYACESWILTAEFHRRIHTMEMRCCRKLPRFSYTDHVTSQEVRAKIQQALGPHEDLLTIVRRCKLKRYGHVSCSSGMAKTTLKGTVKEGRRQGRQKKR